MVRKIFLFLIFTLFVSFSLFSAFSAKKALKEFDRFSVFVKENYPYFGLRNVDWDELVKKYRPMVEKCKSEEEFVEILRNIVAEVGDPHFSVIEPALEIGITGARLEKTEEGLKIISLIDGSPADLAGLRKGDLIIEINGKSIDEFFQFFPPYKKVLNYLGNPGEKISVKYKNASGVTKESEIVLIDYKNLKWEPKIEYKLLESEIGYIKIPFFYDKIINQFNKALDRLSKTKGIILDVRGVRGGNWLIYAKRFFSERTYYGTLTFLKQGLYRIQAGMDIKNVRESVQPLFIPPGENVYKGKVVILMDRFSGSDCEIFIILFKDSGRAILVGEKSAGACPGFVYRYRIGKILISIPTGTFHRLNGEIIEGKGIKPDYYVEPVEGDEKDPFIEKGLEVLKGEAPKKEVYYTPRILSKEGGEIVDYLNEVAISCIENGNINGAIETWKRALSKNPKSFKVNYNLSLILFDLGRLDEAENYCRNAINCGDMLYLHYAYNQLGNILSQKGKYYEAIEEYKRSIELDKNFAVAHYNLGSAYDKLGDKENAEKHWKLAVEGEKVKRKGEMDEERIKRGKIEILVFVEERKASFLARKSLGFLYEREGLHKKAIEQFESALEQIPTDPDIHYELGLIYMKLKNKDKAIHHFKNAIANGTSKEKEAKAFLKELEKY